MKDPADPYVLDVHNFRRAGDSKQVRRAAPAPADLGNPVISVPVGSEVDLDLLLESVVEGVLVDGRARYRAVGQCSRCLEPLAEDREAAVSQLFLWQAPDHVATGGDADEDEALPLISAMGLLDLEPEVRDAIVLDLPLAPVCDDDCPGLCAECGARLADDPGHGHEQADPRWAGLAAALDRSEPAEGGESADPAEPADGAGPADD